MQIDPLETTRRIRETYIRYLRTAFSLQDAELRSEFEDSLHQPELLVKGPIIEATPHFKAGVSIRGFVKQGVLDSRFRELCSEHLPYDRPLYHHQERAIRKAVRRRNVIIATGTGSGKTEGFLIPILNHLLIEERQGTLENPGVRALLLYPMNALANDQLKRLRRVLADYPVIRFGRYTGETPQRKEAAEERFRKNYPKEVLLPNEMHSREEMQARPPHLLLTNYAMLEYLLLRPKDAPFFDDATGDRWRFIVLDEAHVYDGAQATEIGMLIRRLKDRVVMSEPRKLKVFVTSATLGGGEEDFSSIASFATDLFGEPFEWETDDEDRQDVVEAERVPLASQGEAWGTLSGPALIELNRAIQQDKPQKHDRDSMVSIVKGEDIPAEIANDLEQELMGTNPGGLERALYTLLRKEENILTIQKELDADPLYLADIAPRLYSQEEDPNAALVAIISLGVRARKSPEGLPLLPARYHLFARALEGAFLCLNDAKHQPDSSGEAPARIFLRRYEICPECASPVVELASCSRCGLTYLVGQIRSGRDLLEKRESANPDLQYLVHETATSHEYISSSTEFFVFDPETVEQDDEDEYVLTEESLDKLDEYRVERFTICRECGAIAGSEAESPGCDCQRSQWLPIYRVEQGSRKYHRCVGCGARGGGGMIYRFLTGQDAPVSLLAMELYQELPPSTDSWLRSSPGQGRKLLIFTDSRQNAAFFASYLERSYNRSMRRSLIFHTLLENDEEVKGRLRIEDLIGLLVKRAEQLEIFTQDQSLEERRRIVATWLSLELTAIDRRISLEGTTLLCFRMAQPNGWRPPEPLLRPPWNLEEDEAWSVIVSLTETLRRQQVVTFPDGVDPRLEPEFSPRQRAFFIREEDAQPKAGVFGWMPKRGSNSRLDYLVRILRLKTSLGKAATEKEAKAALRGIWLHLTDSKNGIWSDHLTQEHLKGQGVVYRINYRMYELIPTVDPQGHWYVCDRCGNVSSMNVSGICPTYRCEGHLQDLTESNRHRWDNLYRRIYQQLSPIPIKAEEHTAQWTSEAAAEVQEAFIRGEVNALSCSTTFELGVDVGDLQAVLLRNMPPRTANYVQRAGRAGRRTDSAAFSLTYAQRRSHDLTFYARPLEMISGEVHPPLISMRNVKIIRRHLHSVVFSAFFRQAYQAGDGVDYRSVGDFFFPTDNLEGTVLLRRFLEARDSVLLRSLERIIPLDLQVPLGIQEWSWINELADGADGVLDLAEEELSRDVEVLERLEQEMVEKKAYLRAERYQKVVRNLKRRNLLGYLGTRNILPKYGFPVDVVELKTDHLAHIQEALKVELDRDLRIAISEFAPGGQVVAAKKIWQSGGIRKLPGRELEEYSYVICPTCRRFHHMLAESEEFGPCDCGANLEDARERGTFIIPVYGFIAARELSSPGESRPQRIYSSRIYFADYEKDIHGESGQPEFQMVSELSSDGFQVEKGYSRYGILTAVNNGFSRHFRICTVCGFAEPVTFPTKKTKSHKNPLSGQNCSGYWETKDIGHRFITDVLHIRINGHSVQGAKRALWRSLLYALLEGASDSLGIRRDDIDGTIHPHGLILFDNVPGGAGHVERIQSHLPEVFKAAYQRVERCECGPETSCYECLRNYYNQYYHDELQRGLVVEFLSRILKSASLMSEDV